MLTVSRCFKTLKSRSFLRFFFYTTGIKCYNPTWRKNKKNSNALTLHDWLRAFCIELATVWRFIYTSVIIDPTKNMSTCIEISLVWADHKHNVLRDDMFENDLFWRLIMRFDDRPRTHVNFPVRCRIVWAYDYRVIIPQSTGEIRQFVCFKQKTYTCTKTNNLWNIYI